MIDLKAYQAAHAFVGRENLPMEGLRAAGDIRPRDVDGMLPLHHLVFAICRIHVLSRICSQVPCME